MGTIPESPPGKGAIEMGPDARNCVTQFRSDNNQSWCDDSNAVGEHLTAQLSIQQGNADTSPGEPQPQGHVMGTVRHQQSDRIAAPEALGNGPAGVPAAVRRHLTIGESRVR